MTKKGNDMYSSTVSRSGCRWIVCLLTLEFGFIGSAVGDSFTWTGAMSRVWDATVSNWKTAAGVASPFASEGDAVFDTAGAGTVEVDTAGVSAASVTVDGGAYSFTGGQIRGAGAFVVTNGASVTLAAPLDRQSIEVASGILRPLAASTNAALFGAASGTITVRDGGTFDFNAHSDKPFDEPSAKATAGKRFRIAGAGATRADGTRLGALANMGASSWRVRASQVELIGDATVRPFTRWDVGQVDNSTRASITGPHTLTVAGSGELFCSGTDVDVACLRVAEGAVLNFQGDSAWKGETRIEVGDGSVGFWYSAGKLVTCPIVATGSEARLYSANGATIQGLVTVNEGGRLELDASSMNHSIRHVYTGGVCGAGEIVVVKGRHEFPQGVTVSNVVVNGGFACFGDGVAGRAITSRGGRICFVPSTNAVYSGYALRADADGTGRFVPCLAANGSQVVTIKDTQIEGPLTLELGLGAVDSFPRPVNAREKGAAVLGTGVEALSLAGIYLGTGGDQPADATLTVAAGAKLQLASGEVVLGHTGGETNNLHRLVVSGGELDASRVTMCSIGHDGHAAEFLVDAGRVSLTNLWFRDKAQKNMGFLPPAANRETQIGYSYEILGLRGGTVELSGDIQTLRTYAEVPQLWLGGGTLLSLTDWATARGQSATFESWGDLDATNAVFTLDTNGKSVRFRAPLQGTASVRIVGAGSFVANDGVQGGVVGPWRVENAGGADLRNAAAFAGGLSLAPGTTATIDIGARTNYVSLAVCAGQNTGKSDFSLDNFWNAARVFPAFFTKDIQKLFSGTWMADFMTYRTEGSFHVPEASVYSFGVSFDDRADVALDGEATPTARNASWNGVGTGEKTLAAGWHTFRVSGKNNDGGKGPSVTDWKAAGLSVGYRVGSAGASTAAAEYQAFSSRNLRMRPANTVRWLTRYIGENAAGWATEGRYDFSVVTNSMQAIHDMAWERGKERVNTFSGWTYVEPEQAGEWAFSGVYDNGICVSFDGEVVFKNDVWWEGIQNATATVTAGWHSFRVVVMDTGGGISWDCVKDTGYGAALKVKRPGDGDYVPFDERALAMSAAPYGFVGGTLEVGAGATLTNASDTPCEVTGTLAGSGTLAGPYRLTGTWTVSIPDGRTLAAVTWGEGADPSALAEVKKIHVVLGSRPTRRRYVLGLALGLEGLSQEELDAKVTAELNGEPCDLLSLRVVDGKAVLFNSKPDGLSVIFR